MARFVIATQLDDGSVASYFKALAQELIARSHQACFVTCEAKQKTSGVEGNVTVFTWPSKRPTGWADAVFLHRLLRAERAGCIIGNFGAVNLCMAVGAANRVHRRIAWYHTLSTQVRLDHPRRGLREVLQVWRKRWVYRLATNIIANSAASARDVQEVYNVPKSKCSVLHFLLPEPVIAHTGRDPRRIVCAARFHLSKGQETLIRALKQLVGAFPDLVVEFLGGGPTLERCKRVAAELGVSKHCEFCGGVPLSEVLKRMASAALCVSPSLHEAMGLVNIEAQAVGTPIVGSNVDGIREIVLPGQTGFLVPPGDPAALAEKLALLLQNESLRRELGAAASEHFKANFSTRNIGRHAQFFEELVAA